MFSERLRCSLTECVAAVGALDVALTRPQAAGSQAEIRTSFDDSSAPLLQHDDREAQYSGNVQFDLECVFCLRPGAASTSRFHLTGSSRVRSNDPGFPLSSACSGASCVAIST